MKTLRILVAAVLLSVAAFGGFEFSSQMLAATPPASGNRSRGGEVMVEVERVQSQTFTEAIEAIGTTMARQSVTLRPVASGRVTEIAFSAGDRVEAGQPLVRLNDAAAHATLASAEATVAEAQAAFDRQTRLEQLGSAAEATLQSARAALLRAEAQRDLAVTNLTDRTLEAPFAGVVGLSDLALGELIDSSTIVTTLDDLSVVLVGFSVPERYLARLARGQSVQMVSPAYPGDTFVGTIRDIDTRVDQATRSIALRAEIPNEDGRLAAGMFMRVSLVLDQHDAPAVPERALTVSGAESYVHIVENGVARRIDVTTGAQQDGLIEVSGALTDGTPVIVTNLHRISDGSEVGIVNLTQAELRP